MTELKITINTFKLFKMHVNIIISTLDRMDALKMTINSLLESSYKDISIHVMVDGNPEMYEKLKNSHNDNINIYKNAKRKDVIYSLNKILINIKKECILYASDDLIFHNDCIEVAFCAMKRRFPDTDGVIGLNQIQGGISKGRKYAFGLIGKKFVERFMNKELFCPEYIHFNGDREMGLYAMEIGKFHYCTSAKVDHIRLSDETTRLGKTVYKGDKIRFRKRQQNQLLWGRNFERLEDT